MKRAVVVAAVALTAVACAGGPRVPEHGTVVGRDYHQAWMQYIPGTPPICSGNPPICSPGTPAQMIWHPETWTVTIRDLDNPEWEGTVTDTNSRTFDQCEVGELWPECWGGVPGA
ncbi:hypothetical protein SEA_YINZ_85 [Mycobacterium phage Yinz]|nr:hypothetical protein SEA_YINZ_85 [Mycobacterium phage Yinz]